MVGCFPTISIALFKITVDHVALVVNRSCLSSSSLSSHSQVILAEYRTKIPLKVLLRTLLDVSSFLLEQHLLSINSL